ncbi:hypothetical protein CerSpe_170320 [Prunus speciosa]
MTENTLSADQLLQQWDSLDLGGVQAGIMLAGTIIADKPPNREAAKGILKKAWSGFSEAKIMEVKDKTFAITVSDATMAKRILDSGPWSVMGFSSSIQPWPSDLGIEEIQFHLIPLWVQAHGVPLKDMTTAKANRLGRFIGDVLQVEDPVQAGGLRGFLRVRVLVDISKPLPPGFGLPRSDLSKLWIAFCYEKLSNFCHGEHDCSFVTATMRTQSEQLFGEWMGTGPAPSLDTLFTAPGRRYSDPVAGVDHTLGLGFGGTAGFDIPTLTAEQEESLHLSSVPGLGITATAILSEEHSLALGMGLNPMEFGNQPMLLGTPIHDSNMVYTTISLKPSRAHVLPSDTDSLGESLGSCLGPILGNNVADVDQPPDPFLLGPTTEHIMGTRQQGADNNFVHGWSCKTSSKGRVAKRIASVFPPDLTPAKRRMHVAPFGDDLPTQKRI